MQNKKLVILSVLSILAFISLIYGIVTPSKARRRAVSGTSFSRQDKAVQLKEEPVSTKRRAKRTGYKDWPRDPFSITATTSTNLTLIGIIWDSNNPKAMIDDDIVGIGDEISGNTVVDIKEDKVVLNDGVNDFEIRFER